MAQSEARLEEAVGPMIFRIPSPLAPMSPASIYLEHQESEDSALITVVKIFGGCAIILVIGFTVYLIRRSGSGGNHEAAAMNERIAQIESRMTDTQDVMIALSEKLDRIGDRDRKGDET
jgi:hypothetical protein